MERQELWYIRVWCTAERCSRDPSNNTGRSSFNGFDCGGADRGEQSLLSNWLIEVVLEVGKVRRW